jgi:3-oxoisoapionate kinase
MNIPGPLLSYLGDDFTGSTDVMEAFTAAGVPTVLFLKPPDAQWVERFSQMRCIGLATTARSKSPEWMEKYLPDYFEKLKVFGAPILQYKVCSTFDSAPHIGSIGKALEIGRKAMPSECFSSIVVGVPQLKRYTAFGNLFNAVNGINYRLDRSPTMSKHPITPMLEADLRSHLSLQTRLPIELLDVTHLNASKNEPKFGTDLLQSFQGRTVLFDVMNETDQAEVGRLIWEGLGNSNGMFSASSSGLQYALVAYWRKLGLLPQASTLPSAKKVTTIAAVSGSCSPVTAEQIQWAGDHGFILLRMAINQILSPNYQAKEIKRLTIAATEALANGKSPLVFSALGPADAAVTGFDKLAIENNVTRTRASEIVGEALAQVMKNIIIENPSLTRIVVAGGDSSGAVIGKLDLAALTIHAGLAAGVPLCRAWASTARSDGLQIALKAGQLGGIDFFSKALGE